MKIIEKINKDEETALKQALSELKIDLDEDSYYYEVVEQNNKSGFLGLGRKNVKIKIFIYDEDEKKILDLTKEFFDIAGLDLKNIKIKEVENDRIFINIETENAGVLIGKRGENLRAFQLIINSIINKKLNKKFQIILDVENYREKRQKVLETLAKNIAKRVRKEKKEVILEPMPPFERKIIHSVIENEKDVLTESIGDGYYKRVRIFLKK
jgi:spoIIIJ-associated protein